MSSAEESQSKQGAVSSLRAFFESTGKEQSQIAKENAARPKTALGAKQQSSPKQSTKADSIERADQSLTASKPKVEARSGRDNQTSKTTDKSATMDQLLVDIGPETTDTSVPASNGAEQVSETVDDLQLSPTANVKSASQRTKQRSQATPEQESKLSHASAKPNSPVSTHPKPPTARKMSPVARRISHNLPQGIASPNSVSPPARRPAESGPSSESGTPAYMRQTSSSISRSSISPIISSSASGSASRPLKSMSSRTSDSRRNVSTSSNINPTSPRSDRGSSFSPTASPTANRGSNRALATSSSARQQNTPDESRRSTSHSFTSKGEEPSYMRPTQASRSHEIADEKRHKNI